MLACAVDLTTSTVIKVQIKVQIKTLASFALQLKSIGHRRVTSVLVLRDHEGLPIELG